MRVSLLLLGAVFFSACVRYIIAFYLCPGSKVFFTHDYTRMCLSVLVLLVCASPSEENGSILGKISTFQGTWKHELIIY